MTRLAIAGGPRTGKSTLAVQLAAEMQLPLVATDDFIHLGWSPASQAVADLLADAVPRVVEGVAVVRALRKALADRPEERPVDRLLVMQVPFVELTDAQARMTTVIFTHLEEILPHLEHLGVEVEYR